VSRLSKENIKDSGGVDFCRSAKRGWGRGRGEKQRKEKGRDSVLSHSSLCLQPITLIPFLPYPF